MWSALALAAFCAAVVPEVEVKVMTYNVRFGTASDGDNAWPKRKDALIALVKGHDPDVLGLQEALVEQVDELRRALPTHAVVGVGRDDGIRKGEHSVVFYRRGMFGLREGGTRWISDTPDVPGSLGPGAQITRVFSWGEFFVESGGRLLVVNAHLDHVSPDARLMGARQMRAFAEARSPVPAIVMGDFNSPPGASPTAHLVEGRFVACVPARGPRGTFNAFQAGATEGEMIDHIFVSQGIEVVETVVDQSTTPEGRYPSDHFPVVARVRLPR
ncbi:MAG: endonuclease/exonuclease/phosphatase family protein [Fimbriimonadaceae bacterium]|nr:endonuclease/exonuclease/phosphatase family protein [Fimbriimonadaceae bacterium]QYK55562.1 MAG: endonuclease/exonuclease/phosphatase family protein [Fimbriimonadaceae bacterium]